MISLAVNGYTEEQVKRQLHAASGSILIAFRYDLLNRNDVKIGELDIQEGGRIAFNSESEIKRIGEFVLKENEYQDIDYLNDRIRPIYRLRMPDGNYAEWSLGVFLMPSPERSDQSGAMLRNIKAYDTGEILLEDKFITRYLIPAGTRYVDAVTDILNGAGIEKVNIQDHPGVLEIDKEFEIGFPKIRAANQLLNEINYTSIYPDVNNYFISKPYVLPSNRESEYTYKNDELSIIYPGSTEEIDLFNVPNIWVVTASNPEKAVLTSTYINDLPTSKTSTVSRKRNIPRIEKVNDILDQATLNDYCQRMAYNDSQIYGIFRFSTALMPHHAYQDCLFIDHSEYSLAAKHIEMAWDMELDPIEGKMNHNCRRVILI